MTFGTKSSSSLFPLFSFNAQLLFLDSSSCSLSSLLYLACKSLRTSVRIDAGILPTLFHPLSVLSAPFLPRKAQPSNIESNIARSCASSRGTNAQTGPSRYTIKKPFALPSNHSQREAPCICIRVHSPLPQSAPILGTDSPSPNSL